MTKYKKTLLSKKRDIPLLKFIWKWKLGTSSSLRWKFYANRKPITAYNQLLFLKNGGFIRTQYTDRFDGFVWTLTRKGFKAIREDLSALVEEGFGSENITHDLYVTAFHLGDWYVNTPTDVRFFTEQQLRRHAIEEYPTWVPKTQSHRPDGYSLIPVNGKAMTVAFEVELTLKPLSNYQELGEFYSEQESITKVMWLVPSETYAGRIQKQIDEAVQERANIHNFVTTSDFKNKLWNAPITLGPDKDKSISQLFNKNRIENPEKNPRTFSIHPLLDVRKCPFLTDTSATTDQNS